MYFVLSILNSYDDVLMAVIAFFAFILAVYFAIIPHEIAHGLAAKWNGDLTAQVNGRLTLNPVSHFDPIGFLMLLFMGFGYAKPVPVNPYNFKVPRRGLFMTAVAGVTYNLAAMIVSCLFLAIVLSVGVIGEAAAAMYAYYFFYWFFWLGASVNVSLFLFNLLPFGPLDGFKIIEAYARRDNRFIDFLRRNGNYILIFLFALHLIVYYIGIYIESPAWLQYVDILGLYIRYGSLGIAGSIQQLFNLMFGLPVSGWSVLSGVYLYPLS